MLTLEAFNRLSKSDAETELMRCCGSSRWARAMIEERPFSNMKDLFGAADRIWNSLTKADWLESFTHHPRIGDATSLRAKFAATANWAQDEQKGAAAASEKTIRELAAGNREYEKKFDHIFLVCATGKSADEMLDLLKQRLNNSDEVELRVAAGEQSKITKLRLEKLLRS